jgi:hypothetical protein
MQDLPEVKILIDASKGDPLEGTMRSIEEQDYKKIEVLTSVQDNFADFVNNITIDNFFYVILMRAGDEFAVPTAVSQLVQNIHRFEHVGATYTDSVIINQNGEGVIQYLPPFDYITFNQGYFAAPIMLTSNVLSAAKANPQLSILMNHELILRAASNFIVSHMAEALFVLPLRNMDISQETKILKESLLNAQ